MREFFYSDSIEKLIKSTLKHNLVAEVYPFVSVLVKHVLDLRTTAVKVLNHFTETRNGIRGDNHSLILVKM